MDNFYNYLYLGLYRLLLRTTDKDIAEYSAAIFLTLAVVSNVFCILVALGLNNAFGLSNKAFALLVVIPLGIFNYYYFVRTDRYKVLADEFDKFGHRKQNRISAFSLIFIIESVALPVAYKVFTT